MNDQTGQIFAFYIIWIADYDRNEINGDANEYHNSYDGIQKHFKSRTFAFRAVVCAPARAPYRNITRNWSKYSNFIAFFYFIFDSYAKRRIWASWTAWHNEREWLALFRHRFEWIKHRVDGIIIEIKARKKVEELKTTYTKFLWSDRLTENFGNGTPQNLAS